MNIMFVCTGNICRSAMAHAMLQKRLKELDKKDINVYSCGIYAENYAKPPYYAIEVMKEYDVDIREHEATNIFNSKIQEMDLILIATNSHKIEVIDIFPNISDKVFTMKEYIKYNREYHDKINIVDPWGYGLEEYRYCAAEIYECIEELLKKI